MDIHLVVVRPFGKFARGDAIFEPALVSEIANSEHAHDVVRVVGRVKEG